MRARLLLPLIAAMTLAGCSSDLFHSTSWQNLCELDPANPGCESPMDAGPDAEQDAGDEGVDGGGHESGPDASDGGADVQDSQPSG
ncbi:MAG: hypothetical protein HY898_22205 [Deltaproteobacteria bacterium]|nr:hypothetical protein [Deltaproteobacteria bacterium]